MLELDDLDLVLDDLLISIHEDEGVRVHFLKQRELFVQQNLILPHFGLDVALEVRQIIISDGASLLGFGVGNVVLDLDDELLLAFDLVDEAVDGLEVPLGDSLLDLASHLNGRLFINIVPLLCLAIDRLFDFMSLQL